MTTLEFKKGILIGLIVIGFIALVLGFFQIQKLNQQSQQFDPIPKQSYQTGKAFEVIEPEQPANQFNGQTPETLIEEAEQIIARANAIVEKNKLDQAALSPEGKEAADERFANIEREIEKLQQQLDQ